jgi:hypothetical protein
MAAIAAILAIALSLGAAPAFADGKIGVASAVKNEVQGRGARALSVGSDVFANERIRTGDASTAQFMFLDKTVMSMGPKAELVLDKFVYNPNRSSGQVVVNAVQGSMRFVTGGQSPTNYQIKTPVATIGIRGTVADFNISPSQTFIGVVEGSLVVRFLDGTTLIVGKGEYIVIAGNGKVIGKGPYNGSDPNSTLTAELKRLGIDDIDQLNAVIARNYIPPARPVVEDYFPHNYFGRTFSSGPRD